MPDEAARRWGHKEALYHEDQRWSFTQFQREVNRTAKGLISLGVQPEDKVPLWVTNRPEWPAVSLLHASRSNYFARQRPCGGWRRCGSRLLGLSGG